MNKKNYIWLLILLIVILLIFLLKPVKINKIFKCNIYNLCFQNYESKNIMLNFNGCLKKRLGFGFIKSNIYGKLNINDIEYNFNLFKSKEDGEYFYTGILEPSNFKDEENGWNPLIRISNDFNYIFIEYMTKVDSKLTYKLISGTENEINQMDYNEVYKTITGNEYNSKNNNFKE